MVITESAEIVWILGREGEFNSETAYWKNKNMLYFGSMCSNCIIERKSHSCSSKSAEYGDGKDGSNTAGI